METTLKVPVAKFDEDEHLVFGWANMPHPTSKSAPRGSIEKELDEVRAAYLEQYPAADQNWTWVVATFPEYIIAERYDAGKSGYYRHSYAKSADTYVFGEGVPVEQEFVAKALNEPYAVRHEKPKVDLQGDRIYLEDLEKAAYEYVEFSREGDEMHTEEVKARLVESFVVTPEKLAKMGLPEDSLPLGWWIGMRVLDDDAFAKVKDGTYRMFSIGGIAVPQEDN